MSADAFARATGDGVAEISRRLESVPPLPIHLRWATVIGGGCFHSIRQAGHFPWADAPAAIRRALHAALRR